MSSETRTCQNCKQGFIIEPEDFDFYKKIDVPQPTWCPECRLQRKMLWRNERTLYKQVCNLCKTDVVSMYSENSPYVVYCNSCWWSDQWDSLEYAKEYNFSKLFFAQFRELMHKVPRLALYQKNVVNSPYVNHVDGPKNSYLTFDTAFSEEIAYSKWVIKSQDVIDCYGLFSSELCYELQDSENCYKSIHLLYSVNCTDSAFLLNCRGCSHCFLSSNLRNKSYYFANQQLSKDEYSVEGNILTIKKGEDTINYWSNQFNQPRV